MKKEMRRAASLLLACLMALTLFTGCSKKEELPEETAQAENSAAESSEESSAVTEISSVEESSVEENSKEESSQEEASETEAPIQWINPLSGEKADSDMSQCRPFVFMCNNLDVSMPHCGVSQADMIMEMMDESTITRFMVWFMDTSNVPKIGSVRSARQYNVETAMGYDAILCHCGGSSEADATIWEYGVEDLDAVYGDWGGVYYRDETRQTYGIEHSMFARGERIMAAVTERKQYNPMHEEGYDGTYGMIFSENAADQCAEAATTISVCYAGGKTTDFVYSEETKAYTMYQYGGEYTDDGEGGIPFTNVINMYAYTELQSDGYHLTIDLSEGEGTFFTEGKAVAIKWYKDGYYDCFHFTLEDGTPLAFNVGKTFICVNQVGDPYYTGTCSWE